MPDNKLSLIHHFADGLLLVGDSVGRLFIVKDVASFTEEKVDLKGVFLVSSNEVSFANPPIPSSVIPDDFLRLTKCYTPVRTVKLKYVTLNNETLLLAFDAPNNLWIVNRNVSPN